VVLAGELNIAEIPYPDGTIRFRYARYQAPGGKCWIRHGLFQAYWPDGSLASEGTYVDGAEHGLWVDLHQNGRLAARGHYEHGVEVGQWEYWTADGSPDALGGTSRPERRMNAEG
jgi:antitoxin component YwqK of YwqJK toxin-antitoxin module